MTELKIHHGQIISHKDGVDIISCESCEYIHTDPLPTPAEIKALYERVFYSETKPEYIEKMTREEPYWTAMYKERIGQIEELINPPSPLCYPPLSVLDLGCGPGFFLKAATELGWDATGLELSQQAAKNASQYATVFEGAVETFDTIRKFDAIHMSFLIEHLVDPASVLRKIHGWLRPGGILVIECPRDYSCIQRQAEHMTERKGWWEAPSQGHCSYFDAMSLRWLLSRNGFSIQKQTTTFPIEFFLLAGDNYVDEPGVGTECHKLRMDFETLMFQRNPRVLRALYDLLDTYEVGRELVMFCRKESS